MARKREKAVEEKAQTEEKQPDTSFDYGANETAAKQDTQVATQEQAAESFASRHAPTGETRSHAEAIGKREPGYSAAGITDKVTGMRLKEHQNPYLSIIRFEEKPSDAVRAQLRDSGFTWNNDNKEWTRPIAYDTRQQDRLHAERTFNEVNKLVREERGIEHGAGISAA